MIKRIISKVYKIIFNITATIFPVRKDVVLFESFNGKLPSDNPYAIYQELVKQTDKANLYWGIKKVHIKEAKQQFPDLNLVPRFSVKWLWLTTRANFWVFNSRMPNWLKKNKGTIYIQTWHGTPLKKLGADIQDVAMPGTSTEQYKNNFILEASRWDYLIAPNEYSEKIFKQAFQFQNNILEIGYPRNDELVNNKNNQKLQDGLKEKIIGKKNGRVILYAPTWRDDYFIKKGSYKFYMPFSLEKMVKCLGQDDTLIIRPHYLVGDSIDIKGYEDRVKVCMDEAINDLYLISDLLITDYSSVMFDFAILQRPMLFYPYDMAHYKEKLRGFYLDYNEVPGPIAEDEEKLYEFIRNFVSQGQFSGYDRKKERFEQLFCSWESGEASQKITNLIVERESN
ncbi:MAG: CDP-glycerol glycerophosphotransferase family protein [Tetragenococcus koreensis]|uniref:CDP-glycerol glycerophosphotransferase family protein n=1 Tax=Tetragenococcus halophilus TaxID=51669 RepID=UPI000CA888A1|nr:CDP-glycerol glycerophosphotransferase family protein [Tetragenococcus halophilus]MDN6140558.1 CDP-glycerol glycerophosphotransferase family protein [Tetragenococcus koreensis]MDN6750242.1 CDP-glycerol glycerophosphotransferase family protein [Staphylococcus equorum]MCF1676405.1 CDP-glycerol glycerophosphotransferase family protein [Tetragenococcus halophilus]MDN6146997.1 CDP-glycerol glycerophosphotransferase family protein [Tetragenococcus koreensis]MDN6540741.1 CDP-glycerol glycerophosph